MPDYRDGRRRVTLEAAGYVYNKDTGCWVNKAQGRAVSRGTVEAHDEAWLEAWIAGEAQPPD